MKPLSVFKSWFLLLAILSILLGRVSITRDWHQNQESSVSLWWNHIWVALLSPMVSFPPNIWKATTNGLPKRKYQFQNHQQTPQCMGSWDSYILSFSWCWQLFGWIVGYKRLNQRLITHAGTLNDMEQIVENLARTKIKSSMDLRSGFWNVKLSERASNLSAFILPNGRVFKWLVMPFGFGCQHQDKERIQESQDPMHWGVC